MNFNNDFKYDLKLGQVGEKYLAEVLQNKKIEVKTDFQATKTGNLFIEYESRGKLSGLATSEAEWYAFILSNEFMIMIKTTELKDKCRPLLNTNKDIRGGDSNTSKGILLPIKTIL